jgi:peroxiredoxin/tetratricopeptide (TPR) repeat protein
LRVSATITAMPFPLHALLVGASLLQPQESRPKGHSHLGEAFDEGPRQAAYLMPGTGNVHLQVTTRDPAAQRFFDQGMGQLHGFWYFEAERSFRQAAAIDPDCAMAYWGMAMATVDHWKRAAGFAREAVKRKAGKPRLETLWIDALAAFYEGTEEPKDKAVVTARHRTLERAMEAIVREFPQDIEAKALLVNQIWINTSHDLPLHAFQPVDVLLDQVFAQNPMHPAHHYRIHLWDDEKPEHALLSAARSGQSAPGVAHMWHMGGHIFAALHRHADAAWQQDASARVDHAQMLRDRVMPYHIANYTHNNEWLARSWLYVGRVQDALALARNLVELPRHPKLNTPDQRWHATSQGRATLLEITAEYELWDELRALSERWIPPDSVPRGVAARHHMLLARAGLHRGDMASCDKALEAIERLLVGERAERAKGIDKAEADAKAGGSPDDKVAAAMTKVIEDHQAGIKRIEGMATRVRGHRLLAEGKKDAALAEFQKLGEPGDAEWAAIYLRAGDAQKALEKSDKALADTPGRVPILARHVLILKAAGKTELLRESMDKLRRLAGHADLEVPLLARLQPIAAELGLPQDWRLPEAPAADVGERPALDSLGPLHWRPWTASAFDLPARAGGRATRADFAGKPLLVVFYLGMGCPHCVTQLERLATANERFAKEGIQIVAIGSDGLAADPAGPAVAKEFPFPLLADPELHAFRAWRAYDDFEKLPLHGTFLLDRDGKVRWQEVSFEPFTDVEFLLGEARRLLALVGT